MRAHPQAKILRAIADGKQMRMRVGSITVNVTGDEALKYMLEGQDISIKPETININGHEVPAPVREPLKLGQMYFFVHCWDDAVVSEVIWNGDRVDRHRLKWGLIHSTKEAAIAHAEALLSFTRSDK